MFNIWDMDRVNIKVKLEFLEKVNKKIKIKFKSQSRAWEVIYPNKEVPFGSFKSVLKPSTYNNLFVPLETFIRISDVLSISREEMQENITSYKTAGGVNCIEDPILPILVNPVFHMLFAHHIGDGGVTNPMKGRLPYFGYRQYNDFYRLAYIKKLEFIFGKICYKEDYLKKSTMVYCPPVLSTLFFKYYKFKVTDFLSDIARIPTFILNSEEENILAILIAFVIDEGHVDSTELVINLKNKSLIEDLEKICKSLKYVCKVTQGKSEIVKGYARLHILREGMKSFYKDYLKLNKRYPIIDLGWKGEKIKLSFKIVEREIIRKRGNDKIIIDLLDKEQLTVNQLAERINMTRQGVRYHIHNLLNLGKIRLLDSKQLNWVYGV